MSKYEMLFSPAYIGKCEIKNRIVMAPMLMGFGDLDGKATEQMMRYYEERAKGGTGLIVTEITRINDTTGAGAFAQLGASKDNQVPSIHELAERIHRYGAKVFVELHHPGRQNMGLLVGTVPVSIAMNKITSGYKKLLYKLAPTTGKKLIAKGWTPRAVAPSACEPSYFVNTAVRALKKSKVKRLIRQFIRGAERVQRAGCDGVVLHASHGYLIQQFLSPHTNQRTDEYGGDLTGRMKFLTDIISGIRAKLGDFPIVVRLTVDEFYEKIGRPGVGYTLAEGVEMARRLEAAGIDAIDVSSAAYDTFNYWLEPTSFDCGWRAYLARAVKEAVKIPVIAANLIRSPEQAEAQLQDGTQDFVALGRPQIADAFWAQKAERGEEQSIERCICCLMCIESMYENAYVGGHAICSVNPLVGREAEAPRTNGDGRTVAIIGAGVAGLTAAETLVKRGFKPVIFEKSAEAGGQVLLAATPPKKQKLHWCVEDMLYRVTQLGVNIRYNTAPTADDLRALNPYAIIIATGSIDLIPRSITGIEGANVVTATDILSAKVDVTGKKIAVIGSGMTGLETAEYLAEKGNAVFVIEKEMQIAPKVWMQHRDDIMPRLTARGVDVRIGNTLTEICEGSVRVECADGAHEYECDLVVLALGRRPTGAKLAEEYAGIAKHVICVGDAERIGRIANATNGAYDVASTL